MRLSVSLPDALAEEVRRRDIAISAVCQHALREEVKRLRTIEDAGDILVYVESEQAELDRMTWPGYDSGKPMLTYKRHLVGFQWELGWVLEYEDGDEYGVPRPATSSAANRWGWDPGNHRPRRCRTPAKPGSLAGHVTPSAAREARSPLVGFLLAIWIGLRTLSFFSSPDKTLGLQRPGGKEARLAAVGRESGCGDRQAVPAVRRQLHGPREKRQKEIDTIVIACKLLTRGPSRVDQAAPGSSHEVRHNARRPPVRRRARGAPHDHLPALLDQSAPGGAHRGRASLAARPVAVRSAVCAHAHMAERRHRSDLGGNDSKQPNGTPV